MRQSNVWDRVTEQTMPSTAVTHLHLFRHGKPDTGRERRCYGQTNVPLAPRGEAQHRALAHLAATGDTFPRPDGVLTSDLVRCQALGEALADAWGVPLVVDPRLREQHMGDWEGQTWAALTAADVAGIRGYWTHYADTRPPGGESLSDVAVRIDGALADLWPQIEGRRWAIASHSGVLRVLLCRALGLPISDALRFAPLPGTHTWLMLAEAGAVVQVMGERPVQDDAGVAAAVRRIATRDRKRPPRLTLAGSAGTGKTTLGRALSEHFGVPYVPEGMRSRIEGGLDLHALGHEGLRGLVVDLWREQQALQQAAVRDHGGFVADRSPMDFAAFWITYHFTDDHDKSLKFFTETRAGMSDVDRIIVLPWGVLPLVADGVRTANPWVQRGFQALLEGLVQRECAPEALAWMPDFIELSDRVEWVDDLWRETIVDGAVRWTSEGMNAKR